MTFRLLLATLAVLGAATPAHAQENLFTFDYLESTSTHSLEEGASQAQYQLDTAFESGSSLVNQLSLAYGLTNTLSVAGALQMGGVGGTAIGSTSYQAGLLYAPGIATRSVANSAGLDFVPIVWEPFDLLMRQRDYFRPPLQALIRFLQSDELAARAQEMGGFDLGATGTVRFVV